MFTKETELAAVVKKLKKEGWSMAPEVSLWSNGPRADWVAYKGLKTWAIACKLDNIKAVYEDARKWTHKANLISVALPALKANEALFSKHAKQSPQIGILGVFDSYVVEVHPPRYYANIADTRLRDYLRQQHSDFGEAGSQHNYWTPYREFLAIITDAVPKEGIRLELLIDSLPPHGFQRDRIKKSIQDNKCENIKLWHRNHKDYLYPIGYGPHGKDKV